MTTKKKQRGLAMSNSKASGRSATKETPRGGGDASGKGATKRGGGDASGKSATKAYPRGGGDASGKSATQPNG